MSERVTVATLAAQVAALTAAVTALTSQVPSAPAKAEQAVTFHTAAEVKAGAGFPCTADKPCGRTLKTAKRASAHGVDAGGHEPRES